MSDHTSLLPQNATPVELALEHAITRGDPDLSVIATLTNPDRCPVHLLGYLAWAFSVDTWDADWSEPAKRAVIRNSILVHRQKGTRGAVERALGALGMETAISEWFEHGGAPHTFFLEFNATNILEAGYTLSQSFVRLVDQVLSNTKPVRSHYQVRVSETVTNKAYVSPVLGEVIIDDAAMIMEMP